MGETMARNSSNEKWVRPKSTENEGEEEVEEEEEEEEEEEALSLCDLPICNEANQMSRKEEDPSTKTEEDFDFGSWGKSVSTKSEMCAADDVFFQGQIVPLRHSISSIDHFHNLGVSTTIGSSSSSRSSSIRSQHSSSSGSSTTTTTTTNHNQQKVRNQFHSHPSPSPQIRNPSSRYGNPCQRGRKSTMWSLFKVGLVQTPGIELRALRTRNSNKSFGSRNSNSSSNSSSSDIEKQRKQKFLRYNGGLFAGCRCSVDAVDPRVVIGNEKSVDGKEVEFDNQKENATKKKNEKKQAMSRHRTFEWIKELSIPDEA